MEMLNRCSAAAVKVGGMQGRVVGTIWADAFGIHFAYTREYVLDFDAPPIDPLRLPVSLKAYSSSAKNDLDGDLLSFNLSLPSQAAQKVMVEVLDRRFQRQGLAKARCKPIDTLTVLVWTSFFGSLPEGPAGLVFDPTDLPSCWREDHPGTFNNTTWIEAKAKIPTQPEDLRGVRVELAMKQAAAGLPLRPEWDAFYSTLAPLPDQELNWIVGWDRKIARVAVLEPPARERGEVRKFTLESAYLALAQAAGITVDQHQLLTVGEARVALRCLSPGVQALASSCSDIKAPRTSNTGDVWVHETNDAHDADPEHFLHLVNLCRRMDVALDENEAIQRFLFSYLSATPYSLASASVLVLTPVTRSDACMFTRRSDVWTFAPVRRLDIGLLDVKVAISMKSGLIARAAQLLSDVVHATVAEFALHSTLNGLARWGKIARDAGLNDTEQTGATPAVLVSTPPTSMSLSHRRAKSRFLAQLRDLRAIT